MSFGMGTIVADDRCDIIINAAIRNWNEQKNFRFPPTAVKVEFTDLDPVTSTPQITSKELIIVTDGNNGLCVSISSISNGQPGSISISMVNEKYYAMIDRLLASDEPRISSLSQLKKGFRNAGFGGLVGSEIWIDRVLRSGTSGGFLASSRLDLHEYVKASKSGKVTAECTISDSSDQPHRIRFEKPLGSDFSGMDRCTFGIDVNSLLVIEVEYDDNQSSFRTVVESFLEIGGVKFPETVTLTHHGAGLPASDSVRVMRSTVVSPESLGFDNQQLYLAWYGLAEPNATVVATRSRSNGYFYIAFGLLLAIGTAILYWRKNR